MKNLYIRGFAALLCCAKGAIILIVNFSPFIVHLKYYQIILVYKFIRHILAQQGVDFRSLLVKHQL